ncbi:ABC transporter ATP-binding protein [Mycoplasmopsis fermentans]|uniref:ABC transporter domain-containing protein n=2 Tax=Mycoplasmopsis fermentans TaxID=2115 RepID=C4XDX4_MYCFP|nr:ABC transporter ATP-binding protein [Mycoplasmopsis fermentans]VEU67223.1 ABC transporter, ATP-binding protein [Mesomycoplasma conjunctivae]ADV34748.1 ABC transporter ATP-binding protein [Mycoplasmopsis fermentans M64]RMX34983.1 ABC transporter family protein [Mycoplasmopsis fermentans MF-I1]RMX35088.1 ABC transporter family protein [Mycoplasmopsis fermentans MF-I2]VEU63786.1 ABC transporter, ATP-binding protein [Mycoplasmopsis fermentans]
MSQNAIEFKNVTMSFKNFKALDNVTFSIKKGEFHGFIGANGAGKTTSFRSLLYFYPEVQGEILIDGINFKNKKSRIKIGYVPEVATFPKSLNIYDYLVALAELNGLKNDEAKKRIEELLIELDVNKKIWKKIGKNLSSGQQKKVILVQALIHNPEILILDEPAANLDPKVRNELYFNLSKLHKQGKTIFVSSHILSELEQYIDSLTVLDKGKVLYSGDLEILKNSNFEVFIKTEQINETIKALEKAKLVSSNKEYQCRETGIAVDLPFNKITNITKALISSNIDFENIGKNIQTLNEKFFKVEKAE